MDKFIAYCMIIKIEQIKLDGNYNITNIQIILHNFIAFKYYSKMDNFIQQQSQYAIIPRKQSQGQAPSSVPHSQTVNKLNTIVKQLNCFLKSIPICQRKSMKRLDFDQDLGNRTQANSQFHTLFAGVLEIDLTIRKFFNLLSVIRKQVRISLETFYKKYNKFKQQNDSAVELLSCTDHALADLQQKINYFTSLELQQQFSFDNKAQNQSITALQKQNRTLKQNFKRLEQKYKHVLLQQKGQKQKDAKQSTQQSLGLEDNYGFHMHRPVSQNICQSPQGQYQPMRISVELLQKKLKQVQKQNANLKKMQEIDYSKLIEQLERQIQGLRMEKRQNQKIIAEMYFSNSNGSAIKNNKKMTIDFYPGSNNPSVQQNPYFMQKNEDRKKRVMSRVTSMNYFGQDHQYQNQNQNMGTYYTMESRSKEGVGYMPGSGFVRQQQVKSRQRSVPAKLRARPYS